MIASLRPFVLATSIIVCCYPGATAQDTPATATAADWPALIRQRAEIFMKLQEIQRVFQEVRAGQRPADAAEIEKLRKEGEQLVATLQKEVFPRMHSAARELLKQETLDDATADVIAELAYGAFQQNRFQEAAQLADAVVAKNAGNAKAVNVSGVVHFAQQDFEGAVATLERAKKEDLLIPDLGGQYLEVAPSYVEYWRKEQEIRAKESSAQSDQLLPRVSIKTSRGDILLELFENEAPNTVANFVSLVEGGFYNGTKFHRVIPAFMAQGGDPNTKEGAQGEPGSGGPGYTIKCECYRPDFRRHFAGSLSMAHTEDKDTGGSQFFITHVPTFHLDEPFAPAPHTVFGRVVEGMDVVLAVKIGDVLQSATVVRKRDHDYRPETQAGEQ
jgi:cyclophilin family peptidyl-prolyl cis-trans isomerase